MAGTRSLDKKGNAAIEFALVGPLFIAILMGAIQFGLLFHMQAQMGYVARNASRLLSVEEMTMVQAEAYVNSALTTWGDGSYTTSVVSASDVYTVTISIPTEGLIFFPIFTEELLGATLTASASMRAEAGG